MIPAAGIARALLVVSIIGSTPAAIAAEPAPPKWSDFLSRGETGADAWTKAHPEWDGRGVVVAVLDTGIDPSVPGLDRLPTGGPKLIETRDFSGQGHVAVARAEVEGDVLRQGEITARGVPTLGTKPLRANDYWLGAFDEAQLANGEVGDIDRNGQRDDRFAVLAFRRAPDGEEVVVVDTDGDGDLGDEKVRRAYGAEPEWFVFGTKSGDPRADKAPIAVTVTPLLDDKRVELHFDDGSHGSHCAGIATGFGIDKQPGFDGIAPGARLMSLKIGHNGLAGGATTSGSMAEAIRFASRWAKEHETPVVMSISYGVGSDVEGTGEIQKILDDELQQNRWLMASLSAGNEGPGLSSVGNPSGSLFGWSAGALVPDGAWDLLFGAKRPKAKKIFSFSSRGGELDKPDGLTPGIAWSTVPPYLAKSVKNGTSMAAPQASGVMALLVSAALAEKRPWTPGLVKRAMRQSAKAIAGYSSLEQGAGIVTVPGAWEVMKKAGAADTVIAGWQVSTPVPGRPGTRAPVSFWRVGGHAPDPTERIVFKIEPRFYRDVSDAVVGGHVDSFTLEADGPWLKLDRTTIAIRGKASIDVQVGLDRGAFDRAGHYVGRVRARQGGLVAFELVVAVVVPERLRDAWERAFAGKLEPGDVSRVFVEVPPGATGMRARLAIPGKGYGNVFLIPFDPAGDHFEAFEHQASSTEVTSADVGVEGADLAPGIWELTMVAPVSNRGSSSFELTVEFVALDAPSSLSIDDGTDGRTRGTLELTNRMGEPFRGGVTATIDAVERSKTITVKGARGAVDFAIAPGEAGVTFELELDGDVWNRFSDIAVNVLDGEGGTVEQSAFGTRKSGIGFVGAPGRYTLEILGGHADKSDERDWKVKVVERHRYAAPVAMDVEGPNGEVVTLYPGVPTELELSARRPPGAPDGFHHRVVITLANRDGSIWSRLRLPLK